MRLKLDSFYVTVSDMQRAIDFYRRLFQKEPEKIDKRFSYFDLEGVSFGLYNPAIDGDKTKIGTNCVPNFRVENIEEEFERIKQFAPAIDDKIQVYGSYKLFQFKDSEGNILEVYQEMFSNLKG